MNDKGSAVLSNSLEGRWIALRPLLRSDYMLLYNWAADLRSLHLWCTDRRIPPFEEFCARVDRMLHESQSFLVLDRRSGNAVGFGQAYDINLAEGWGTILVYAVAEYRCQPHPAEAGLLLVDSLFKNFPLRKLYADVFEYNRRSIDILEKGGFRVEARLPEHLWYEGRYWSLIKLALYRDQYFQEVRRRWDFLLRVQHEFNSVIEAGAAPRG